MKVDDVKIALKRSDGAHRSVVRALEDDRMVTLKGDMLLIEQRGGEFKQFRLGEFFAPQKRGVQKLVYRYVKVKG